MKNNLLEHIILYVIVACVALIIATLARISATAMGFDNFTTFIVFIVVIAIQVVVYLSIHVFLQSIMLPWIGKGLAKIPYFKKRVKVNPTPIPVTKQKKTNNEQVRSEYLRAEMEKFDTTLKIAHEYTQKIFAPYLSDSDINRLCSYINIYAKKEELKRVVSIKLDDQLSTTDIYHFGWNIWNHFPKQDQIKMAEFLKIVFAHTFREVENTKTIKKKLKIFEPECIIQIQEDLSE